MLAGSRLKAVLGRTKPVAVHGPWSRAVAYRHLLTGPMGFGGPPQPLWGGAAKLHGARFTPPGSFDSIYLAWCSTTALAEVQSLVFLPGGTLLARTPPWVLVTVDGVVSGILDLTDSATLLALGSNEQEITGSWQLAPLPPTQLLAQAVFDSGRFSGIRYPSTKHTGGDPNLVVFPDRLGRNATDFLDVFDPHGNLQQRIGA